MSARTRVFVTALLCSGTAAAVDDAALARCAAVSADAARLACYDALARRSTDAESTPGVPATAPLAVTEPPTEATFGKPKAAPKELDSISTRIAGPVKELAPGTIVKLENGQRWKLVADSGSAYRGVPDNADVVITRGFLGSYWMEVIAIKRQFKVKRIS